MLPELSIAGYADKLSVAPGETIEFKISDYSGAENYHARLLRMHTLDDNKGGCGLIEEPVGSDVDGTYPAHLQRTEAGSFIRFDAAVTPRQISSFTVQAYVMPTLPGQGRQTILAYWSESNEAGLSFDISERGHLQFVAGSDVVVETAAPLLAREWYFVSLSFDAETSEATIRKRPLRRYPRLNEDEVARGTSDGIEGWKDLRLTLAARQGHAPARATQYFNGKIDRLRLLRRATGAAEQVLLAAREIPKDLAGDLLGFWDFALEQHSTRAVDLSARQCHGTLVNLPTRAVTGFNWRGQEQDFKHGPEYYGAIHFHDDDQYDVGWQTSFAWTVPKECPSGCYAVKIDNGGWPEYIVFFVRPPRGVTSDRPKVAFIAPVAHYLAYANYRLAERDNLSEAYRGRLWEIGPEDAFLAKHREFGHSLYELHSDGSGVAYSSHLRPILNLRPNTRLASLAGDGYVMGFFRKFGIEYDVITDLDIHADGVDLLDNYDVLVTGGHPEYISTPMWDALEAYQERGGNLMYMGGNGFYWRIAWHQGLPGVIEVRRSEDGTRPWVSEPGEYYMSFNGEYGGMWRRVGRTPNTLVGVGFTAQGFDHSTHYVRKPDADDRRAAFVFEGVSNDIIGDYGVGFGGAAGQEIDRFDIDLGSPPHGLILASSEGHTDHMLLANEDMNATHLMAGGVENPLVRADMTFFETGHGGAVFSTGAISWVAAMPWDDYDNDVARITLNVLKKFMDGPVFERTDKRLP